MRNSAVETISGVGGIAIIGSLMLLLYGYVVNIVHFAQHINVVDGQEVLRGIGMIVPVIGAVLGWVI